MPEIEPRFSYLLDKWCHTLGQCLTALSPTSFSVLSGFLSQTHRVLPGLVLQCTTIFPQDLCRLAPSFKLQSDVTSSLRLPNTTPPPSLPSPWDKPTLIPFMSPTCHSHVTLGTEQSQMQDKETPDEEGLIFQKRCWTVAMKSSYELLVGNK